MGALQRVQRVRLVVELLVDQEQLSAAAAAELQGHLALVEAALRDQLLDDHVVGP